ncbi:MAG: S49 family peptidase [Gammaproteobacteria bacterium]|nr:S49 family peptidase [Gammaproteobacteria bacterium]MBL6819507.1 S49 family peptidase [Gammaproteobacteria bacterium]MBL6898876.1 S49 family peptidase [Gammaproteobacteria bacterium]
MTENDKSLNEIVSTLLAERKRDYRNKIILRLFFFIAFLSLIFFVPISKDISISSPHVALIEINGLISSETPASAENIIPLLNRAAKNTNAEAIIIKVNSGGGSATQSKIIFDEIRNIKKTSNKTIISIIEDVGASGGYYIAMAADQIIASETSIVGSIGVRLDSYDARSLFNKLGIKSRTIYSGENKLILDPFHELTSDQYNHVKNLTQEIHEQFIADLIESRKDKINPENKLIYSGLFYTGLQAKNNGLIDDISSVYKLKNEKYKNIKIHKYNSEQNIINQLIQTSLYNFFQLKTY